MQKRNFLILMILSAFGLIGCGGSGGGGKAKADERIEETTETEMASTDGQLQGSQTTTRTMEGVNLDPAQMSCNNPPAIDEKAIREQLGGQLNINGPVTVTGSAQATCSFKYFKNGKPVESGETAWDLPNFRFDAAPKDGEVVITNVQTGAIQVAEGATGTNDVNQDSSTTTGNDNNPGSQTTSEGDNGGGVVDTPETPEQQETPEENIDIVLPEAQTEA